MFPRLSALLSLLFLIYLIPIRVAHAQENPQKKENFSRTEETQAIHKHRLKKLIEQLSSPKVEEKVSCKYESDIALAPPHKIVLLSFDDGPDPEHTQYILDTLEKHDVPGTFFMIAEKMQIHADLVSKVSASKYATIGNHSWSHPNFHEISSENQSSEIEKSDAIVSKIVTEKFFRYPYGNATCESNQQIRSRDYKIVGWHVDSCDWAFDHKGVVDLKEALSCGVLPQNRENFMAHVLDTVKERHGGIILMHEIHGNTIRQLDQLIIKLKEEGYTFGKITDKEFAPYLH